MKNHRSHVLVSCLLLAGATALSLTGGCSGSTATPDEHFGRASQDLDADQCNYFDVDGKDTVCHHTGSVTHPFTLIKISDQACINGHAGHVDDYITSLDPASSLYDPTCGGQGCLPTAAPCDGTLECCTGSCVSGACVDPCSPNPCQNDGTCAASGSSFTCTCTGGFTGTNCEIPPNVCENFVGTGCYWQENASGNFCWVPSPAGFPDTIVDCQALDSCSPNGGGLSGGGCYRWADCSLCSTIYPNPTWP